MTIRRNQVVPGLLFLAIQLVVSGCSQDLAVTPETSIMTDSQQTQIPATRPKPSISSSSRPLASTEVQDQPSDRFQVADRFQVEGIYSFVEAEPTQVELVWLTSDERPLGQMERARAEVESSGVQAIAVMNAGIYTPAQAPAGLHIENGVERVPINLNQGDGNFHLLPNGVFYIANGQAQVRETEAFEQLRQTQGLDPTLAVQSGPLLLIDGQIHPAFSASSESRFVRNGVGVTGDGQLLFLNANQPVTFWEFATEFLDRGAVNALYLDGSISRMEPVAPGQAVPLNIPFAGMLVITE